MTIPVAQEQNLPITAYGKPLTQVAREMGRNIATLHRWRVRGILDSHRCRRKLVMTRCGGRWHVRDSDLSDFFGALATNTMSDPTASEIRSPTERSREAERAARRLDRIGI